MLRLPDVSIPTCIPFRVCAPRIRPMASTSCRALKLCRGPDLQCSRVASDLDSLAGSLVDRVKGSPRRFSVVVSVRAGRQDAALVD
jgi:hypothetical protein